MIDTGVMLYSEWIKSCRFPKVRPSTFESETVSHPDCTAMRSFVLLKYL